MYDLWDTRNECYIIRAGFILNIRISSQRMSAVIHFFHFLSRFHDSSTGSPSSRHRLCSCEASVNDRGRVTRLQNLSTSLANKTRTRWSSLISTLFTGPGGWSYTCAVMYRIASHRIASHRIASLRIASHRRYIMRVWLHIPHGTREQKGWNAPALNFLP